MTPIENLRARINTKWPPAIKQTSEKALATLQGFYDARALLNRQAADFVPSARTMTAKQFGRELRGLGEAVQKHRDDLVNARKTLHAKAVEGMDKFGAEIRQYVRGLSLTERTKLLLDTNASTDAIRAVLAAPLFLSGLDDAFASHVRDAFLQREFSAEVTAADEREAATEHAATSLNMLRTTLASELQFPSAAYLDAWLETEVPAQPVDTRDQEDAARMAQLEARLAGLAA